MIDFDKLVHQCNKLVIFLFAMSFRDANGGESTHQYTRLKIQFIRKQIRTERIKACISIPFTLFFTWWCYFTPQTVFVYSQITQGILDEPLSAIIGMPMIMIMLMIPMALVGHLLGLLLWAATRFRRNSNVF